MLEMLEMLNNLGNILRVDGEIEYFFTFSWKTKNNLLLLQLLYLKTITLSA